MNNLEKTTDLKTVRRYPKRFSWGKVTQILDVGPDYTIVVYRDEDQKTQYHPYVKGEDTSTSCDSLDEALIIAMAENHKTMDMARAAARLLIHL